MKTNDIKNLKEQIKLLKESHENQQKLIELQEIMLTKLENDLRHEKDLNTNLLSSYDNQKEYFAKIIRLIDGNDKDSNESDTSKITLFKIKTVAQVGEQR